MTGSSIAVSWSRSELDICSHCLWLVRRSRSLDHGPNWTFAPLAYDWFVDRGLLITVRTGHSLPLLMTGSSIAVSWSRSELDIRSPGLWLVRRSRSLDHGSNWTFAALAYMTSLLIAVSWSRLELDIRWLGLYDWLVDHITTQLTVSWSRLELVPTNF